MSLPPSEIPLGAMRFNSDSQKLEYWMGSAWMQIQTFSPNLDGGARAIRAGGQVGGSPYPRTDTMDFVTIASAGNASDFGDMFTGNSGACCSTSNNTRGVIVGADLQPADTFTNTMQYLTISSTGDTQDFGDMLTVGADRGMTSDSHGCLE